MNQTEIDMGPNGLALAYAVAAHFENTDAPLGQMARDFIAKATARHHAPIVVDNVSGVVRDD